MAKNRKSELDKFYTKPDVSRMCLSHLRTSHYDYIIDPSAGDGSFSHQIDRCVAFDIKPDSYGITRLDYLTFDPGQWGIKTSERILVVGNPPFGNNSSLIFKFFKVSAGFADTIAFILPKSFKKPSFQDRVPLNFHLSKTIEIPDNSFLLNGGEYNVPCVFQIWDKSSVLREKTKKLEPKSFRFVKDGGQISIRRVGVNAGNLFMDTERSKQSHYFIETDNVGVFTEKWERVTLPHNNTSGCNSISQQEIIKLIDYS